MARSHLIGAQEAYAINAELQRGTLASFGIATVRKLHHGGPTPQQVGTVTIKHDKPASWQPYGDIGKLQDFDKTFSRRDTRRSLPVPR